MERMVRRFAGEVFPARAGMNREIGGAHIYDNGVPRTRGDEPG